MTIRLTEHWEKLAPTGAFASLPTATLLYHQLRTVEALQRAPLVINSYNTGTGKTRASLLHLCTLRRGQNVLFIAPTNALLHQHVQDIQQFVDDNGLLFRVIEIHAAVLRRLGVDLTMPNRNGEKLHRLLRNPQEFHAYLGIASNDHRALPFIIVVNPDIFHYMLFFRYHSHDERNLFEDALKTFWYVVVDEFHYYDEKQLVSWLCFLLFWQEWGYFAEGRKVCLLSATPNEQIEAYLTSILGSVWEHVSPDNEPEASANYATVQTLSALELEISDLTLEVWLTQRRDALNEWLQAGMDGAVISNSLARINVAWERLNGVDVSRITGPEPPEQRAQALRHQLLLATPVVDIGYNFDRDKPRQNIDFVVCEGRYRDDLVQRIGRAGRVLGKDERHHLSHAVALVSADAAEALRPQDGQTLDRRQFRDLLHTLDPLPAKHRLDAYIRTHGITEAFYPVYRVGKIMLAEDAEHIERLYQRIRAVFAPGSKQTYTMRGFFDAFDKRETWWNKPIDQRWSREKRNEATLVNNFAAMLSQYQSSAGKEVRRTATEVKPYLSALLANAKQRAGLEEFIASQYHLTRSLFAFRDSFNGPPAVIYDDNHLFSSQKYNCYDVLHLIAHYNFHLYDNRSDFVVDCGETELHGEFYTRLAHRRDSPLQITFALEREDPSHEVFIQRFCRCPVALNRVQINAREKNGDLYPLRPALTHVLDEMFITLLIVPKLDEHVLLRALRGTSMIARPMVITCADSSQADYFAVAGSAAWHAEAALRRYFMMRQRQEPCDAIFA